MPGNTNCCIYGCNNTYSIAESQGRKVSFHIFPSNPERRNAWIQFAKRDDVCGPSWESTKNSRICSDHFVGKVLSSSINPDDPGYAPSLHPRNPKFTKPRPTPESMHARSKRAKMLQEKRAAALVKQKAKTDNNNKAKQINLPDDNLVNLNDINMSDDSCDYPMFDNDFDDDDDERELPPKAGFCHQEVQTEESIVNDKRRIKSNSFVSHSITIDNIQHLSTQVTHEFEPVESAKPVRSKPLIKTRDQSVGQNVNVPTFYGYKSIEEQQENRKDMMEHLTGVKPPIFHALCRILTERGYQPRVYSIEDMLLMFLMKLKHDNTFRCLAIIFNMKLTTVRNNYYDIRHRLYECIKNQIICKHSWLLERLSKAATEPEEQLEDL